VGPRQLPRAAGIRSVLCRRRRTARYP
jgi:hypothetical protein